MLSYRRLSVDLFTDTLITKVKSRRGNLYDEILDASNGWKRDLESEAHEGLSLLFQRASAPPRLIDLRRRKGAEEWCGRTNESKLNRKLNRKF